MPITCPRCLRTLPADDAPAFCMHCGQKLRADTLTFEKPLPRPQAEMGTAEFLNPSTDATRREVAPEPAPREIGGYRLLKFLGAGGMGTVYEAESESGSRVAVKLLSSRLASNPSSVERFKQEGRLASQLSHPRCVFVLAADADAGRPYIVMELMPGRTLKDLVDQRGPLPPDEAIAHTLDAIAGLAEAHRLGVLHRDVKPSNCFLTTDGRVKVGDFGLSKSLVGSRDQQLTQSGAFLGTVLFASPEQIRGEPLDYSSDVYSLCATLYYLLCGKAPYEHESVTAALAKAISEPPPPLRSIRPEVPRALDKVVMTGLERDRARRFETLDDLYDALTALLPEKQTPARPRLLVGAYLLDLLVLFLLVVTPLEVLHSVFGGRVFDALTLPAGVLYFAVLEGLYGTTAGKALLGLRVRRVGASVRPGLWRGAVSAAVFFLMVGTALAGGPIVHDLLSGSSVGRVLAPVVVAGSCIALLVQLRKRGRFRGLHDMASGCQVTQKPRPTRKLRLQSVRPSPLDVLLPPPVAALPEVVGGYSVRGRLWEDVQSQQVWAAEDRALGRKTLLWLRPGGSFPILSAPPEVSRPSRLRQLGHGRLTWANRGYDWTAFSAPTAPLADTINPARPLPWADARFLLEQLSEELRTADADGSLPKTLSLSQVWVEPTGRVQVLEFPVPHSPPDHDEDESLALVRRVASLTLEGAPRSTPEGVRAPLPTHAVPLLNRLFDPKGHTTLGAFADNLAETHAHAPEVTPSMRAAHLGLQAAGLAPGLMLMLLLAGILSVVLPLGANERANQADAVAAMLKDPNGRLELGRIKDAERALKNPAPALDRLGQLSARKRDEAARRRAALPVPLRYAHEQLAAAMKRDEETAATKLSPHAQRELLAWAGAAEKSTLGKAASPWTDGVEAIWIVGVIPLVWLLTAALFRGGPTMALAGIAVVRADGRPAFRRQCAVRAAVVWLPVAVLLVASVWVQVYAFNAAWAYLVPLLLVLAMLPVYVVVALREPTRPPQDRIAGTYLVPA